MIRAAGAVLWRRDGDGRVEVAVIHRPKYDDWTLPKGKLEAGESVLEAAVREVAEETGFEAVPGEELGTVEYQHAKGRKTVRYWSMEAVSGSFQPHEEVDEVRWLPPQTAAALLTFDRDRQVLAAFASAPDRGR